MELTTEQEAIRDLVHEFAVEEIRPLAREADETEAFPESVWDGLAELDLMGMTVPEEYGGIDADPVTYSLVNEQLAYGTLAVATAFSVHCLATSCIASFGTDEQKTRWLPDMAEGRPVGAFALSETGAGSNPAQMQTTAERDGDSYVINGDKQWITNGKRADVIVLFAKTGPEEITQFVVPKDAEGLSVGPKEDKLGLRASDTTPLTFDNVRIPAENRLTPEGKGLSAALSILTGGRIAIASQAVGLAQSALDATLDYVADREQFGGPISEIQAVRHTLAEMHAKTEAGRLLAREAARKRHADAPDASMAASTAKYVASENAMDVTNDAVQLHGGYGYTTEFPVERLYRDAKITTIYEGTTQIQKTVIARGLLGE
ncbi:acyl-CoA dehydrogenase family protein [Halocatena pleomorpha]|uniref:Acyl-CoA dehydrogenase n=1 Tax=Halocatena pleomorpha TaxID=1785090 RepID=A0A3P3RJ62_9EURY|nr:acyl-CoA dehydrogenase family protein [Halocatena pleomorpha]RRJ33551.1 acyl-CoA dehydrogenase [Halocatena pleomorpha]